MTFKIKIRNRNYKKWFKFKKRGIDDYSRKKKYYKWIKSLVKYSLNTLEGKRNIYKINREIFTELNHYNIVNPDKKFIKTLMQTHFPLKPYKFNYNKSLTEILIICNLKEK